MPSNPLASARTWPLRLLVGVVLLGAGASAGAEEARPVSGPAPADLEEAGRPTEATPKVTDVAPGPGHVTPEPGSKPGKSERGRWDGRERTLWTSFLVASALDAYQTVSVTDSGDSYRETNPLYGGDRPGLARVIAFKGLAAWTAYQFLLRNADHPRRKTFLKILTGLQLGVVLANEKRVEGGILVRW